MDFFRKAGDAIHELKDRFDGDNDDEQPPHAESAGGHHEPVHLETEPTNTNHRFQSSFAPSTGDVKWYVDGASYFHAVSMALEEARESIYILDWWLSPELYLRRPPAKNEKYRLDNMLKAAAERGVEVRIIVYKEVKAALSCDSAHTKHALEALHENVQVFRHPDHVPNKEDLTQSFAGLSLNPMSLAKASTDALASLYGSVGESVLFWAHHEKLCVVDRKLVFMGGLDMCFGRWDTNSHPIADAHPGDLDAIIFPGQDFNNARAFDFEGVDNWDHNQLDRTKSSRMGWSDITISMQGPIVNSLLDHFTDRWNFIHKEKYTIKDPGKYQLLSSGQASRGGGGQSHGTFDGISRGFHRGMRRAIGGDEDDDGERDRGFGGDDGGNDHGGIKIQLCRRQVYAKYVLDCCEWSSGHPLEHSIANAYINAISNAEHFIYIENQFFITATGDKQRPVQNRLGAAIVDRVVRAHDNGENFHVIVVMPAVPAFPGDLKSDGALGTRAIMEFQYNSISRGGASIVESVVARGVQDWGRYLHFYNLRTYDRLNVSKTMRRAEQDSGVPYERARHGYDERYAGEGGREDGRGDEEESYGRRRYQEEDRGDGGYGDGYGSSLRGGGYDDDEYGREDRHRGHGYGGGRREEYGGGDDDSYGRSERRGDYEEERYDREDQGERRGYGREYQERRGGDEGYGERREEYGGGRRHEYDDDRREEHPSSRRRDEEGEGGGRSENYDRYQQAAAKTDDRTWDTVASCYMDGGPDIRTVPWEGSAEAELDAFVSEELYIHSKVLIADDKLVICGSANINDRSQLGDHDSEIAVVIEDPTPVESTMDGRPFTASRFATSLRRQLYRKHIGLLPDQPFAQPHDQKKAAWTPVSHDPQVYDWGSRSDELVADPMSRAFWEDLWLPTARTNTEVFEKAFHPVPSDQVRNWDQYDEFFGRHFVVPGAEYKHGEEKDPKRVPYGHVVREEFPGGAQELKEQLARVRGTLVEMPLNFLVELGEDLAMEGVGLNFATKEIYT